MSPIVKCLAMALVLIAVGGCAYRDALVLEDGEKVDSLYYHGADRVSTLRRRRHAVLRCKEAKIDGPTWLRHIL